MIEMIEVIPIDLQEWEPRVLAYGTMAVRKNVLVRLTTDQGHVGVGETEPIPARDGCNETQQSITDVLRSELPAVALHRAAADMSVLLAEFERRTGALPYARAAFGDALYDLAARQVGVALWRYLGGRFHKRIPASWSIGFKDSPEKAAEEAVTAVAEGYHWIKIKIGRGADTDIPTVEAVRGAVGPNVRMHVDANASFSYAEALPLLRKLERYDLALVEQPLASGQLSQTVELRRKINIPIMLDESVRSIEDMLNVVSMRAADAVLLKLAKNGGIHDTRIIAQIARHAGLLIYPGTHRSSSIGAAASAHAYSGLQGLVPGDFAVGPTRLKDDIVVDRVKVEAGWAPVPDGHGIGVEVDERLLSAVHPAAGSPS